MFTPLHQPYQSPDDGFGSASLGGVGPIAYNPLNKQVGDAVTFRDADLSSLEAVVEQQSTTKCTVDGETFFLSDYELLAKSTDETAHLADNDGFVRLRLRCIPTEDGMLETIVFQAQRLDEGANWLFDELVKRPGAVMLRDASGGFQHGFTRLENATEAYTGIRATIGDPTRGEAAASEIGHFEILSLDYERETKDAAGDAFTQWGLVEFNQSTNAMVTLFGWSIDASDVH